jgi:trans-aconitate methyltransferase
LSQPKWNAALYDNKLSFVSTLGKSLMELLQPRPKEAILDLGCGTGDLTAEIARHGAQVTGIDASREMIHQAVQKYPDITFLLVDAHDFRQDETFDAIFSNAVFHWISHPEQVVRNIHHSLKPNGRLVMEFGGKGNVHTIVEAIRQTLLEYGIEEDRNPWYFPSLAEFATLLEAVGFRVTHARHYDRPTPLSDGERGLFHWLDMFAGHFFTDIPAEERPTLYRHIAEHLQDDLWVDGQWIADYKRLQVVAVKE